MADTLLPLLRRCGKCRELKPDGAFSTKPSGIPTSYCKPCGNAYSHSRHAMLREKEERRGAWKRWAHVTKNEYLRAFAARATLKRRFRITLSDYCDLIDEQRGRCAICGDRAGQKNLAVDHCHHTGKVRGLLCMKCNLGIGHLGDDIGMLETAIAYLKGVRA